MFEYASPMLFVYGAMIAVVIGLGIAVIVAYYRACSQAQTQANRNTVKLIALPFMFVTGIFAFAAAPAAKVAWRAPGNPCVELLGKERVTKLLGGDPADLQRVSLSEYNGECSANWEAGKARLYVNVRAQNQFASYQRERSKREVDNDVEVIPIDATSFLANEGSSTQLFVQLGDAGYLDLRMFASQEKCAALRTLPNELGTELATAERRLHEHE